MKKYELTDITRTIHKSDGREILLYRIKAVRDIEDYIEEGDLGGWVEKESNLSQEGSCWVANDACIYDEARVLDNALVCGSAEVYGFATVADYAMIDGSAKIYENAQVTDHAYLCGMVEVHGNSAICDQARVSVGADIYDNAKIRDNAEVYGNAIIHGDAIVSGRSFVGSKSDISAVNHCITVGPIDKDDRYITFYRSFSTGTGTGTKICATYQSIVYDLDDFISKLDQSLHNRFDNEVIVTVKLVAEAARYYINQPTVKTSSVPITSSMKSSVKPLAF